MEDFKERNRLRRQQNAFDNLLAYAERTGIKNPENAAEKAAQEIHGGDGDGPVAGTSARAKRVAAKKAGATGGGKKAAGKKAEAKAGGKKSAAAAAGKATKKPAAKKAAKKPAAKKAAAEKAEKKPAAEKADKKPAAEKAGKSGAGGKDAASLDDQTKDELYAMAQDLEIEGRSSMNKDELIDAIKTQK